MQKKSLFFLQFKKRLNRKAGGFTLVEIIVVVTIIIILFSIILFIVSQYVNRSKDSNIEGNLVILIPSGEAYYTGHGNNSYEGFCDSSVVENAFLQIPSESDPLCEVNEFGDQWAACAKLFVNKGKAFCVDSRGVKEEMDVLKKRLDCFVFEDGAVRTVQELEKRRSRLNENQIARLKELQDKAEEIRRISMKNKLRYERQFPITDYLVTDPDGFRGNVGFNISGLEDARERGYKERQRTRAVDEFRKDPVSHDELKKRYESLLDEAAEFIENLEEKTER